MSNFGCHQPAGQDWLNIRNNDSNLERGSTRKGQNSQTWYPDTHPTTLHGSEPKRREKHSSETTSQRKLNVPKRHDGVLTGLTEGKRQTSMLRLKLGQKFWCTQDR